MWKPEGVTLGPVPGPGPSAQAASMSFRWSDRQGVGVGGRLGSGFFCPGYTGPLRDTQGASHLLEYGVRWGAFGAKDFGPLPDGVGLLVGWFVWLLRLVLTCVVAPAREFMRVSLHAVVLRSLTIPFGAT